MEIFDALDSGAHALGVSQQRRLQTRVIVTQANWRLRNQPPQLVIADTLDKVDKLAATDVAAESQLDWIAGRAGEQLFWQQQQGPKQRGMIITEEPEYPRAMSSSDSLMTTRERRIGHGGRVMGLGLLVFGVSAAATAAGATPMVFVATAGAIMFVIGLITLLIGLLTPAGSKG